MLTGDMSVYWAEGLLWNLLTTVKFEHILLFIHTKSNLKIKKKSKDTNQQTKCL